MKLPKAGDYYTIIVSKLGHGDQKHFKLSARIVDNYKKYLIAGSFFLISLFVIGLILFSNYNNALSKNREYANEINKLKQENMLLDEHNMRTKLNDIENNIGDIRDYLSSKGFLDNYSRKPSNNNIMAENNIDPTNVKASNSSVSGKEKTSSITDDNMKKIDYFYSILDNINGVIKTVPLGYPYTGQKTSGFGPRGNPFGKKRRETHKGIDFRGPVGDLIKTTSDGVVKKAGRYGGYGNAVIVEHEFGLSTLYGHMSKLNVKEGQTVKAGDVVGYLGSTGRSTGPHLHYEVRKNNKQVNPEEFLKLNL